RELDGDGVVFTDGTREQIDCIIYSTGYKVTFPFLKPEVVAVKNNDLPLFQRVFHPHYRDLFFLGLLQPLGAIMPIAEAQSHWISKYLLGECTLPSQEEMKRHIQQEREAMRKRYGDAPRHTMQVDFAPYMRGIQREMKQGMKRPGATPLVQRATQAVEVGS
ncbi:MAG: NAD(P)/FAD-dependent oxidoreductase, partial [Ktedonobacteraceae bacterium]